MMTIGSSSPGTILTAVVGSPPPVRGDRAPAHGLPEHLREHPVHVMRGSGRTDLEHAVDYALHLGGPHPANLTGRSPGPRDHVGARPGPRAPAATAVAAVPSRIPLATYGECRVALERVRSTVCTAVRRAPDRPRRGFRRP